jgi:integrase
VTVQVRLGRMKESSAESCRSRLRLQVVPFFGQMRLDAITLPHVREFMKALLAKELSPKTVLNVMVVLKEMLKHAVQWGYLDTNPAQYAERPRGEDQEMQILTPPEIRRLLDTVDEPVRTLILCAVLTGMRRDELLGLRWEDVDLEGHRISSAVRSGGRSSSHRSRGAHAARSTWPQRCGRRWPGSRVVSGAVWSSAARTASRSSPTTSSSGSGLGRCVGQISDASGFTTCATRTRAS